MLLFSATLAGARALDMEHAFGNFDLGKDADFVRQSDIDKIRYPELIMKLAHQQGGTIKRRDVEQLLHLQTKQAYRELSKLVDAGELVSVGRGPGAHYEVS